MDNRELLDTVPWHKLRDPAPTTRAYTPPAVSPPSTEPRWAMLTAVTLAVVAGIVVFAVVNTRPPRPTALTQSVAPIIQERVVERVVTATPEPTSQPPAPPAPVVIIVTTTPPPAYVPPAKPQPQPVQRQAVRSLPAPTLAPAVAWPAPPTGTANGRMGYQCADGRYFPADDSRWGMFGFGQWIADGTGDMIDIRDSGDAGDGKLGWHYKCQRVWR